MAWQEFEINLFFWNLWVCKLVCFHLDWAVLSHSCDAWVDDRRVLDDIFFKKSFLHKLLSEIEALSHFVSADRPRSWSDTSSRVESEGTAQGACQAWKDEKNENQAASSNNVKTLNSVL